MKTKIKFLVYPLAVVTMSLFVNVGCSVDFPTFDFPTRLDLTLNLEVNPQGSGTVTGAGKYPKDEQVNITATANEGWQFVNWSGDTQFLDNANSYNTTVSMPEKNITLTANFRKETIYPIYGNGVTDNDGNNYITAIIGDQEWMAENLRVTRYNNGDDIPTGFSNNVWENTKSGVFAIYDHNAWNTDGINSSEEMVAAYGKLYNWYAVNTGNLCPEGWSVPSHDDWTQLEQYICYALGVSDCETHFPYDNTSYGLRGTSEGNALKSCLQLGSPLEGCNNSEHPRWNSHSTHYGFDEFGFSALPGGRRSTDGFFIGIGNGGYWWAATEFSTEYAWSRVISGGLGSVNRYDISKNAGLNVRCFREVGTH